MKYKYLFVLMIGGLFFCSCGETKRITAGNNLFRYQDNSEARANGHSDSDKLYVYHLSRPLHSKIDDKSTYQVVKTKSLPKPTDSISIRNALPDKINLNGVVYTPENDMDTVSKYRRSFTYWDTKFGLQALSIPLKFRSKIGDGSKYPAQVETGVNIGFAPTIKLDYNVFNPVRKIMGKPTNTYSVNTGFLLNLGGTALKASTNAPGLAVDHTAATFTYGAFLLFGVNNINFGYAVGVDNVMGQGSSNWVYQHKVWQGIVVAIDIIKP
jgi:hypothetical protein